MAAVIVIIAIVIIAVIDSAIVVTEVVTVVKEAVTVVDSLTDEFLESRVMSQWTIKLGISYHVSCNMEIHGSFLPTSFTLVLF